MSAPYLPSTKKLIKFFCYYLPGYPHTHQVIFQTAGSSSLDAQNRTFRRQAARQRWPWPSSPHPWPHPTCNHHPHQPHNPRLPHRSCPGSSQGHESLRCHPCHQSRLATEYGRRTRSGAHSCTTCTCTWQRPPPHSHTHQGREVPTCTRSSH